MSTPESRKRISGTSTTSTGTHPEPAPPLPNVGRTNANDSPAMLSPMPGNVREKAATTIQAAVRGFLARKHHMQRMDELATAGMKAYGDLRVFHGTHDANANRILTQGLIPQGGEGLSGLIGDRSRSAGHVFYSKDKEQAAYYAQSLSGIEQAKRIDRAGAVEDWNAVEHAYDNPPQATMLRALLPTSVQQQATRDEKAGEQDFMLKRTVPPGNILPGHLEPDADLSQRQSAVTLFQSQMQQHGVQATRGEALATLAWRRRLSISGTPPDSSFGKVVSDAETLKSDYVVKAAKDDLERYRMTK